MELICDNIPVEYPNLLNYVLRHGDWVSPRNLRTLEVRGLSIVANNPLKRFFAHPSRNANPVFSIVELMWYLSGDDTSPMVSHYVSAVLNYLNPQTTRFDGAYGPRLRKYSKSVDQIEAIRRRLGQDKDTRRAVVTLFDPTIDNNEASINIPCQVLHQFLIRNDRLEMITYARSQDMYKGFVYDTAEWQLFQDILAGWFGLGLGPYHLYIASAHVYENDITRVQRIVKSDTGFDLYKKSVPLSDSLSFQDWERTRKLFYEVEDVTRNAQSPAAFEEALRMIESIGPGFWKNAMVAIVSFNAFKRGETAYATSVLSGITNEFRVLLSEWFSRKGGKRVSPNEHSALS